MSQLNLIRRVLNTIQSYSFDLILCKKKAPNGQAEKRDQIDFLQKM